MLRPILPYHTVRITLRSAVLAILIAAGALPAQAADPTVRGQARHFFECFRLMLTAPATHADECGPGVPAPYDSASDIGDGTPPALVLPPEPVPEVAEPI
jgi:hypothetical protein